MALSYLPRPHTAKAPIEGGLIEGAGLAKNVVYSSCADSGLQGSAVCANLTALSSSCLLAPVATAEPLPAAQGLSAPGGAGLRRRPSTSADLRASTTTPIFPVNPTKPSKFTTRRPMRRCWRAGK